MSFAHFRKFDGMQFHMTVRVHKKEDAEEEANELRRIGYRVRIIKGTALTPLGKRVTQYLLYTRSYS
jgi:hypothetical protein